MLAEALGLDRLPATRRVLGEHELDRRRYARQTECDWTAGFVLVRRAAFEEVVAVSTPASCVPPPKPTSACACGAAAGASSIRLP